MPAPVVRYLGQGLDPSVCVVVPYRGDNCGPRDVAWDFCATWWEVNHPGWSVVAASCGEGPWRKGVAVANALTHWAAGRADILVVADADVLCPDVAEAVQAVAEDAAGWAMPHTRVHRLDEQQSQAIIDGGWSPDLVSAPGRGYRGVVGGGLAVLPTALYRGVPIDLRFHGWGQEDLSWGHALTIVAGHPWRGPAPLWHLWHPPAERDSVTRGLGNPDGVALYRRYRSAYMPSTILAIVAEQDVSG